MASGWVGGAIARLGPPHCCASKESRPSELSPSLRVCQVCQHSCCLRTLAVECVALAHCCHLYLPFRSSPSIPIPLPYNRLVPRQLQRPQLTPSRFRTSSFGPVTPSYRTTACSHLTAQEHCSTSKPTSSSSNNNRARARASSTSSSRRSSLRLLRTISWLPRVQRRQRGPQRV